jgi:hypothetical protein
MEQRLDGTLAIRLGQRYLEHVDLGALPPNPRSLSRGQHPAVPQRDRAPLEARSPAVTLADGCSGRTPAEPYPSAGTDQHTPKAPYRPAAKYPWRRKSLPATRARAERFRRCKLLHVSIIVDNQDWGARTCE